MMMVKKKNRVKKKTEKTRLMVKKNDGYLQVKYQLKKMKMRKKKEESWKKKTKGRKLTMTMVMIYYQHQY